MSKRILVISQHFWPENFRITDICAGFTQRQITVDVLCGLPNYPAGVLYPGYSYFKPRRQTLDGIEIYRCGEIPRKGNTGARIFLNYISYPLSATFHLLRLIGKHYDAVFCFETSPVLMAFPAIIWSKLTRTPFTMYVLDLWPENLYSVLDVQSPFLRKIAQNVSWWHYKKADKLIAMSPALREKLIAITGKAADKVTVVPQYAESLYEQDVYDAQLAARFANTFNVVFAGNISPAQGLEGLVAIAQRLKAEHITDVRFVIVGDGMSKNDLQAQIAASNVESYFVFEGQHPVADVPAYHTMADVLFAGLKSSGEIGLTIPAKIFSYLAAGRPVLCSMDGEGALTVEKAACGFSCKAGDAKALYENFIKLYNMPAAQRKQLGKNGRAYHEQHFKREKLLGKLIDFIFA
ncbi:MAG: glycosyltransferase family 4 protein [Oscillospiraceae bacterium]|nr:glycosyltransferase family 4 protein [Oscillospiraceae bacterium]